MRQLVYLAAARRDIAEITAHIEDRSASREAAEAFIDKITDYCEKIARLRTLLGRPRPELGREYRSTTFGNYVIFFRYADESGLRSHVYIVHIIHGRRDLDAFFNDRSDNDAEDR